MSSVQAPGAGCPCSRGLWPWWAISCGWVWLSQWLTELQQSCGRGFVLSWTRPTLHVLLWVMHTRSWSCSWAQLGFTALRLSHTRAAPTFQCLPGCQKLQEPAKGLVQGGPSASSVLVMFDSHPAPEGQEQPPNSIFIIKCGQDFASIPLRDEIILANHCLWLYLCYLCTIKKKIQLLD